MQKYNSMLHEPHFFGNEIKYLKKCIYTKWISTEGQYVSKFENLIKNFTKAKYAVALNSGTAALDLSLKLFNIEQNDEVIVPSITFIAPINCVLYQNAKPIFMDSDNDFNIDIKKTIKFIINETLFKDGYTINKKTKKKIKALIVVHVFGNVANTIKLKKLCKQRNIKILEDSSESLGSFYENNVHSGLIGEIGCLSFNANKIITTGAGGMIITNNKKIAERARYLSTQAKDSPFFFIHNDIGYNIRLNNLSAAVGLGQIQNIKKILKKKKYIHNQYKKNLLKFNNFKLILNRSKTRVNYWLNVVLFSNKISRQKLINELKKKDIDTRPVWFPNHLQLKMKKFQKYEITKAPELVNNAICLPSGYNITSSKIIKIIKILKHFE
jgi:perosamine synthetase